MSKYSGAIGYAVQQVEIRPGVWDDVIEERKYTGDVLQEIRRYGSEEKVNNDLTLQNRISVIADLFAFDHLPHIRYVTYLGIRWKVNRFEILRPRIIYSLGEVYNGPTPKT